MTVIDLRALAHDAAMWRAHEARCPSSGFVERAVLVTVEIIEQEVEQDAAT